MLISLKKIETMSTEKQKIKWDMSISLIWVHGDTQNFIDTGYHFDETLYYKEQLIETYNDIRVLGCVKSLNEPKLGQSVELEECSFDKKPKFLFKLV